MKKTFLTIALAHGYLLSIPSITPQQLQLSSELQLSEQQLLPQQMNPIQQIQTQQREITTAAVKQEPAITLQSLKAFDDAKFQADFKNVELEYHNFRLTLENFKKELTLFSQQSLAAQQNYTLFEKILDHFHLVRQKPLTIALVRALQYKSATSQENRSKALIFLNDIHQSIQDIQNLLHQLSLNSAWATAYFQPNDHIIPTASIADVFKDLLVTQFPFKTKRVRRALSNWQEDK